VAVSSADLKKAVASIVGWTGAEPGRLQLVSPTIKIAQTDKIEVSFIYLVIMFTAVDSL
jgi:hypothetical protein